MEAQYIRPEDYKRMELALGPAKAEAWRVKHGIIVGMPPEEKPMAEAGGLGGGTKVENDDDDLNDALPTGGLDYAQAQQDYDLANQKVRDQIQSHIDLLEGARGKLRERRVGPSDSEKWLAIAAALGQPTRTGAFGESLGNLAKTLGEQKSARREAEEKRDLMLEKYGLDVGTERLRLLQAGATQAGQTLRAAMTAGKPKPPVWSENMGQFISPDKPVATRNTVRVGNYNLTQYTDGSLRLRNPDGSYSVYSEDGVKVGDIPAGGVQ